MFDLNKIGSAALMVAAGAVIFWTAYVANTNRMLVTANAELGHYITVTLDSLEVAQSAMLARQNATMAALLEKGPRAAVASLDR